MDWREKKFFEELEQWTRDMESWEGVNSVLHNYRNNEQ